LFAACFELFDWKFGHLATVTVIHIFIRQILRHIVKRTKLALVHYTVQWMIQYYFPHFSWKIQQFFKNFHLILLQKMKTWW
jgi:hypothetical protein